MRTFVVTGLVNEVHVDAHRCAITYGGVLVFTDEDGELLRAFSAQAWMSVK